MADDLSLVNEFDGVWDQFNWAMFDQANQVRQR